MANDWAHVKQLLKEACRETLNTLRSKHPTERFYAFALYDADDAYCVGPSANSESGYEKKLRYFTERMNETDGHFRNWTKKLYPNGCNYSVLPRWSTTEWVYEGVEFGPFEEARQLLEAMSTSQAGDDFYVRQARSFGTSVLALKELSDEGFFGAGDSRIVSFFSVSDNRDAPWLELESARRINPPDPFAKLEPELRLMSTLIYGLDAHPSPELVAAFERVHGSWWNATA